MRSRFKVKRTSVLRNKKCFLVEGTLTRGSLAAGMHFELVDDNENLSLLPIQEIGFARVKIGRRTTELVVLCIPYESEAMLDEFRQLDLVGKNFDVSSPAVKAVYRKLYAPRFGTLSVREESPQYGKRKTSAGKFTLAGKSERSLKKVAASGKMVIGYKRAAKKKK